MGIMYMKISRTDLKIKAPEAEYLKLVPGS